MRPLQWTVDDDRVQNKRAGAQQNEGHRTMVEHRTTPSHLGVGRFKSDFGASRSLSWVRIDPNPQGTLITKQSQYVHRGVVPGIRTWMYGVGVGGVRLSCHHGRHRAMTHRPTTTHRPAEALHIGCVAHVWPNIALPTLWVTPRRPLLLILNLTLLLVLLSTLVLLLMVPSATPSTALYDRLSEWEAQAPSLRHKHVVSQAPE
jgi:hypothetical protein